MKAAIISLFCLLALTGVSSAQDRYLCRNGHVWFYSHTPLEDVEAHNNEVASVLNIGTGDISFQILIKSFRFKRALMEEHFNENYMESEKYPKSSFKGKVSNVKEIDFSKNGVYRATVDGDLTIHDKTRAIRQDGTIEVRDGKLLVKSQFSVLPQDYDIEIPGAVRDKIAKTMEVHVDMAFEPYKKP
jgi:hypothetical protein